MMSSLHLIVLGGASALLTLAGACLPNGKQCRDDIGVMALVMGGVGVLATVTLASVALILRMGGWG